MISLEQVQVTYENDIVLKDITYTFTNSHFYCIIGVNGSGKTTLLKTIMGLCEYEGKVQIHDTDSKQLPKKVRATYVSYLPQNRPLPNIDVYTLIAHGRYPHLGFSKVLSSSDKTQILKAAEYANVTHLLERSVISLSGGERQRVYIAMMIAQDAQMLLLDEVTTFLDIEHQLELLKVLQTLRLAGKGIIMVAHDLPQAFSVADTILLVSQGTIVCHGSPAQVYEKADIKENFGVALKKNVDVDSVYKYQLKK